MNQRKTYRFLLLILGLLFLGLDTSQTRAADFFEKAGKDDLRRPSAVW